MTIQQTSTSRLDHNLEDLRTVLLRRVTFPARQDDIVGSLVAGRSPARLVWCAGRLSPERLYRSVDQVCAELAARRSADRR